MGDKSLLSSSVGGLAGANGLTGKEEVVPSKTAVLERFIPWDGYQRVGLVNPKDFELISIYDKKGITDQERNALLASDGVAFAEVLLNFVIGISALDTIQYVVTLIHELLLADPKRVELFNALSAQNEAYPYQPFFKLIGKGTKDPYTSRMAAGILGILVSKSNTVPVEHETYLFRWITDQLRNPNGSDIHLALCTLQALLSKDQYRIRFFESPNSDFDLLVKIIQTQAANFQLVYEAIYCAWLLTYNDSISNRIGGTGLITALVDVVKAVIKEKVVRLAIASLRNVLDKAENNNEMIDAGFVRMLAILSNKKWGDDDIVEDLKVLSEALAKNMVVLSSFDMYKKEIATGQLTWSPVHKSEKFWRENATRFEENDYQLLSAIRHILQTSNDPVVLSVACYDIGEFVRFHPRGKAIITQVGLKLDIMKLMTNDNPEVKKQALFAIQKTMVTNWEYLAKAK